MINDCTTKTSDPTNSLFWRTKMNQISYNNWHFQINAYFIILTVKIDPDLTLQILEKVGIYSNRFSILEPKILFVQKMYWTCHVKWLKGVEPLPTNIMVYLISNIIWFLLISEKSLMRKLWKIQLFTN